MSSFRFVFLTISCAAFLPLRAADACNDILRRNGPFNTIIQESARSADEQLFEWLKTATWKEFSQKQNAGLRIVLPVDGLPVGADGKYTQEQFQKFVEMRDQGKIRFFREQEFYKTVQVTASEVIAKAWSDCMKGPGRNPHGLTCWEGHNDHHENGIVVYEARYFADEAKPRLPIVAPGGFTVVGASIVDRSNPLADGSTVQAGGTVVTLKRDGKKAITVTLRTSNKGSCNTVEIDALQTGELPPTRIEMFPVESGVAAHPTAPATLPAGYKLIGGGALANWRGAGELLISSYPSNNAWIAQSKDHVDPEIGQPTITVWAIGLYDPQDQWDVKVASSQVKYNNSDRSKVPVSLPPGYTLTGGGAMTSPENPGILLTGSFPVNANSWQANAQDHSIKGGPGTVTAYVIGIKAKQGVTPRSKIFTRVSSIAPHPTYNASVEAGWILTGGGAYTDCPSSGNLLTASYPLSSLTWRGEAKDHRVDCMSTITVSAIGLEAGPGSYFGATKEVSFSPPQYLSGVPLRISAIVVGQSPPGRYTSLTSPTEAYYVTQHKDTLRKVALKFYRNEDWHKILEANRSVVTDPNTIATGTRLVIPQ
jgi:hypothetical protein